MGVDRAWFDSSRLAWSGMFRIARSQIKDNKVCTGKIQAPSAIRDVYICYAAPRRRYGLVTKSGARTDGVGGLDARGEVCDASCVTLQTKHGNPCASHAGDRHMAYT
jgi:hypothetical protein